MARVIRKEYRTNHLSKKEVGRESIKIIYLKKYGKDDRIYNNVVSITDYFEGIKRNKDGDFPRIRFIKYWDPKTKSWIELYDKFKKRRYK